MLAAIVSVWALFVGLAMLMLGVGLQGTLLGLRAIAEGFGVATTGIIMSAYYLGFMGGAWATPMLVRRVGHIRVFAALASLASSVVLIHALAVEPVAWFVMRLISGFAIAGLFVISESWLNHAATVKTRGKILSVYMIVCFGFMALGQLLLNAADTGGVVLFIVISVLVSLSLVPISLTPHAAPPIDRPKPVSVGELYRASPLGFVGCLVSGIAQGAFFSLAAVYTTLIGLNVATTAMFLALPMVCVIFTQFPIGALSDRFDRRVVLAALALLVAALALINVVASFGPVVVQLVAVTAFGGLMIPLYSMSIAHMNDRIEYDQMLGASAKLVFVYGAGSAIGPFVIGWAMSGVGPLAFFWALGLIHLLLGLFSVYRMSRRDAALAEDQGDFVLVVPRATSIATGLAMEIGEEGASSVESSAAPDDEDGDLPDEDGDASDVENEENTDKS